jgi:hypothetical protein
MIAVFGGRPAMVSTSSLTGSEPQPKYFCPRRTWTFPLFINSGAGGVVSNEITFVFAGSTEARALRVNTGQPPTEIHAPRSGYRFVPVAMISAQRTGSSLMS